jgi:hypothetical protein
MIDINRQHRKKWIPFVLASFGWGRGVEAASVGLESGAYVSDHTAFSQFSSYMRYEEGSIWPTTLQGVPARGSGLRDEMTDWEQLGMEDLRC